ncbi:hypothetical protein KCV26_07850 [Petrimonas sulfuriphila]|jgi:Zn finger protein HypA/HybF involved in hydrogenase expression|uniref:hypothetical protein n=1 Tax=Petrimonas sulfuriphila TaxID=285070 RepID=UPI000E7DA0C6|nr:hypothetical protein [Petrimonas sp.]MEA5072217.1 hypothetical protein [Petrimonas sp.]HBC37943.1 hypothetical protein [Porphyromonadaceae bacterium]HBG79174.1 hypothetical protein [Porphyromonadaceae bacterium]HBK42686.1 hypothetical protein [Porphyromonadaceae bacterium]
MEIVKICPNCRAEVIDNFQLCWNCNYSFIENRIVEIAEQDQLKRQITCLRCKGVPMRFSGNYKFHEGSRLGAMGNLFELFVNKETFDLYVCPKCGKVEFFTP